jgi:hypothetical protein
MSRDWGRKCAKKYAADEFSMSDEGIRPVFRPTAARYNQPRRIVTLGNYLATARVMEASGVFRYVQETGDTPYQAAEMRDLRREVQWTRWINALNAGRKWAQKRFLERLDPLLESGIVITVVPSHDPFRTDTPVRELARALAAVNERTDATDTLQRHTKIKRIVYGGPSYRLLHRDTICVIQPERLAGETVLLLDDIARSGASLRACEELLYEAGAARVQAVALGRVVS